MYSITRIYRDWDDGVQAHEQEQVGRFACERGGQFSMNGVLAMYEPVDRRLCYLMGSVESIDQARYWMKRL